MFGAIFGGFAGGTFEANYRCYPVSFLDKLDSENGNKIFLPPSALDRLGTHSPAAQHQRLSSYATALPACMCDPGDLRARSVAAHRVPDALQSGEPAQQPNDALRRAGVHCR